MTYKKKKSLSLQIEILLIQLHRTDTIVLLMLLFSNKTGLLNYQSQLFLSSLSCGVSTSLFSMNQCKYLAVGLKNQ